MSRAGGVGSAAVLTVSARLRGWPLATKVTPSRLSNVPGGGAGIISPDAALAPG